MNDVGAWGCSVVGGGFIEKKATAASIQAISVRMVPIRIIVRTAPISKISPAVSNIFSPDFSESKEKAFL